MLPADSKLTIMEGGFTHEGKSDCVKPKTKKENREISARHQEAPALAKSSRNQEGILSIKRGGKNELLKEGNTFSTRVLSNCSIGKGRKNELHLFQKSV